MEAIGRTLRKSLALGAGFGPSLTRGSIIVGDEAVKKGQDVEAGVVFLVLPTVVAIPIAHDSLFRDCEKSGVVCHEPSVEAGVQITAILLNNTEDLDHVLPNKLNDKGTNPVVTATDGPRQMLFANKAIVVPRQ